MRLASLYALFAAIATGANLGSQWLILREGHTTVDLIVALVVGTLVGMPIKYVLDKRWIFRFRSEGLSHDARLFVVYSAMAVVTTVIFWVSEVAMGWATGTTEGRLAGGGVGLVIGYLVKYRLDKKYVFVEGGVT